MSSHKTGDKSRSPVANRPKLASHQSNSVPTTPNLKPQDGPFRARTPSPGNRRSSAGATKPRIQYGVVSMNPNCHYMTTQTSRRRIPYSIGDELLGPPERSPKSGQSTEEQRRLDDNIKSLYRSLLPSQPNQDARKEVLQKLQGILRDGFPGQDCDLHIFGSSGNLLYTDQSDVDICVTMPGLQSTCAIADLLAKNGMKNVRCVHATKVPIVKIWDPELDLNCDLNLNNQVALKNTDMVKTYIQLDSRARPLAMIIKHWTKKRIINEASGGTLSSYTWTLLLINFLQTRQPPVLPRLELTYDDGRQRLDFREALETYKGFGDANQESVPELLFQFFRSYGYALDLENCVISVREATLLSKKEKNWHRANHNRLCVEEPFNTERNLANTADDFAWRGLHLELRRAFELVAEAKDLETEVSEQYEYPPDPKPLFERPQPASNLPTLTRSHSQSSQSPSARGGRGLHNQRGGRQFLGRDPQRVPGSSGRRASSAAAFGHTPYPVHTSPQAGLPHDYMLYQRQQQAAHSSPKADNLGVHEQLTQLSRQLSVQEHHLRQRLANQSSAAGQMRPGYGLNPQQMRPLPLQSQQGMQGFDRHYNTDEYPATAPLPQVGYPYVQWNGSQITPGWLSPAQNGQAGSDTNPSSPSQTPSSAHRSTQRTSTVGTSTASTRSHSQPARSPSLSQAQLQPHGMTLPTNGLSPRQQYVLQPPAHQVVGQYQGEDGQLWYVIDPSRTPPSVPMEYLGYGFRNPPYYQPQYATSGFGQVPLHYGYQMPLQHRQSTANPTTAQTSRSPSPIGDRYGDIDERNSIYRSAPIPQEPFPSHEEPDREAYPAGINGLYREASSFGGRPRRVSDSVKFSQAPAVGAWQPSVMAYSENGFCQPEHASPQAEEESPSPDNRGPQALHETRLEDEDTTAVATRSSSRSSVLAEAGLSPRPFEGEFVKAGIHENDRLSPSAASDTRSSTSTGRSRKSIPSLDLSAALPIRTKGDVPLSAAKVLTPVEETRTPSPTRKRLSRELPSTLLGLNGTKGTKTSLRPRELPDPPTPLRKENQNGERSISGAWTEVSKKGHKKGKTSSSEANQGRSRGQAMPADVSQRKGG